MTETTVQKARLLKRLAGVACAGLLVSGCMDAAGTSSDPRVAPLPFNANLFRTICQETYPNVPAARVKAQLSGLTLNPNSELFERADPQVRMRVSAEKCTIEFLTTEPRRTLLSSYASLVTRPTEDISGHGNVDLGVEEQPDGLLRVVATRFSK